MCKGSPAIITAAIITAFPPKGDITVISKRKLIYEIYIPSSYFFLFANVLNYLILYTLFNLIIFFLLYSIFFAFVFLDIL